MTHCEQSTLIDADGITITPSDQPWSGEVPLFPKDMTPREMSATSPADLQSLATQESLDDEIGVPFTGKEQAAISSWLDRIYDVDPSMAAELAQECLIIKARGGTLDDMIDFIKRTLSSSIGTEDSTHGAAPQNSVC